MITEWMIYWVTRMDVVCTLLEILIGVCGIAVLFTATIAVCGFGAGYRGDELGFRVGRKSVKWGVLFLAGSLILGLVRTATPTTNELAAILVIPRLANSETIRQEAGDLYGMMKEWLSEQVGSETSPEKPK